MPRDRLYADWWPLPAETPNIAGNDLNSTSLDVTAVIKGPILEAAFDAERRRPENVLPLARHIRICCAESTPIPVDHLN